MFEKHEKGIDRANSSAIIDHQFQKSRCVRTDNAETLRRRLLPLIGHHRNNKRFVSKQFMQWSCCRRCREATEPQRGSTIAALSMYVFQGFITFGLAGVATRAGLTGLAGQARPQGIPGQPGMARPARPARPPGQAGRAGRSRPLRGSSPALSHPCALSQKRSFAPDAAAAQPAPGHTNLPRL